MKIELNYKEYIYAPVCTNRLKCDVCAWQALPSHHCLKFCRKNYIFRTTRIVPSIFHL